jgi:hypothetical protein
MYKEGPSSFLALVLLIQLVSNNVRGLAYTCCKATISARNSYSRRIVPSVVLERLPCWHTTWGDPTKKQLPLTRSIICRLVGNDNLIGVWDRSSHMAKSVCSKTMIHEQQTQGIVPEGGLGSPCIIKVRFKK